MRTSIRRKILILVLTVSLTVSLCIGILTLIQMRSIREDVIQTSKRLTETIETYGKTDLEAATIEGMRRLVYENSQRFYVAEVYLNADEIWDQFHNEIKYLSYGKSGWGFLVDDTNKVVIAPDQAMEEGYGDQLKDVVLKESENEELKAFGEFLINDAPNAIQGTGVKRMALNGREVYVAFTGALEDTWLCSVIDVEVALEDAMSLAKDIRLQSEMSIMDVNDRMNRTYIALVFLLFLSVCLIVVVSFTFSKRLTKPLQELTNHIRSFGKGNMHERIHLTSRDEVEELGNAFNQMTEDLYEYIDRLAATKAHNQEIVRLMDIQHGYYENFLGQLDVTRRLLHDFHQFRTLVYSAVEEGSIAKVRRILEKGDDIYKDMRLQVFCDNMEVNAIVSYAKENCRKQGVEFEYWIRLPENIEGISVYDLCDIIGNLLDNAVEAAAQCMEEGQKWVKLYVTIHESNLMVRTENTYIQTIHEKDGVILTCKRDKEQHGFGISIVEKIVEQYEGDFCMEYDDYYFKAIALLPYRS